MLVMTGGLFTSCAAVPDADKIINESAQNATSPRVMTPRGPLSAAQSAEILRDIGATDSLQRHLAIEQALSENPLIAGNSTRVLRDGPETFRAMFKAMNGAQKNINLEYFIFEDIQIDGQSLGNLLIKKRRQGVAINIIYDSFGSDNTPREFFERLKGHGIKLVEFNPLNPLDAKSGYAINERDHRKILLVDGVTAIIGGVNLSTTYQPESPGKSSGAPGMSSDFWRDTDLEIHGPAVADLQELFMKHWSEQKGDPLPAHAYFPKIANKGDEILHIIGSTPDHEIPLYYVTLLSAIRNAQSKIWIMSAYFVPTHQEMEDLTDAARRGIDVRLLVPSRSDSDLSILMQHSHYHELLEAGVKIYECSQEILHSKVAVIDGVWSAVGSSNFDYRSVVFNDEVDVVVIGTKTGQQLEQMFEDDLRKAKRIDLEEWGNRPFDQRIKETIQPLWLEAISQLL